jgi:hypothetical protein
MEFVFEGVFEVNATKDDVSIRSKSKYVSVKNETKDVALGMQLKMSLQRLHHQRMCL